MPKVTSPRYRAFFEEGVIRPLTEDDLRKVLDAVHTLKRVDHEALRAYLILLYYTGRRPSEILELKVEDVTPFKTRVRILFRTKKRGRAGNVPILRNDIVEEFVKYWEKMKVWGPKAYLFPTLKSKRVKIRKTKKGEVREHVDVANKVYHYVKILTKRALGEAIPPYFFRHNILTMLAEAGANVNTLMMYKGARSPTSVMPYLHYSEKMEKEILRIQRRAFKH